MNKFQWLVKITFQPFSFLLVVLSSESVLWEELSAGGKVTGQLILWTFGEKSNNV